MGAAVRGDAANEILNRTSTEGRSEGLNHVGGVRIVPETFLAGGSEIVQGALLIHIVLVDEFRGSFNRESF